MNGGHGMRYDVLRELACRNGGDPQRLNAYMAYDEERAEKDAPYRSKNLSYHAARRDQGFRLTLKKVKRYRDENGEENRKSNTDLDMAVDLLTKSERLDYVLIGTGDGDFINVVKALQTKGVRVEVFAFDNVNSELKASADQYHNGWLMPELLPIPVQDSTRRDLRWGDPGSRVRGFCSSYDEQRGFGYLQYYATLPDSRIITRDGLKSAWFHFRELDNSDLQDQIPNRNLILEFELTPPPEGQTLPVAKEIRSAESDPARRDGKSVLPAGDAVVIPRHKTGRGF